MEVLVQKLVENSIELGLQAEAKRIESLCFAFIAHVDMCLKVSLQFCFINSTG